ncbi:tRNA-dihydrouridine synthase, partial [Acinetobacter baumannii]|uniref:tRNA-dihydrouridine synthase n=1 Tax=Acinetobacter baumannii TaxID=470 RepID=UPI0020900DBA
PEIFGEAAPVASLDAVIEQLIPYVEAELGHGVRLSAITRHILGLYQGVPGARAFRRHLSVEAVKPGAGIGVIREAFAKVTTAR